MAYQVLARKWRPQRFCEVVGQEHITRTLQNAILQNRVGHAYLFVGPRGTGKTTTARIFAKALNCAQGMVAEPCCECINCREIAQGSSLDVIEIDGASHNKVEHIRDIRENVQYTPSRGRFKVYIIDEVHMLTSAAWNALLKTLEEPPPHVKFLFATTEAHKVLPTIVSRCQRFDLKGIPVPLISARLRQIAEQEAIHVDDGALNAIARAADGGMRDAQSVLDQIIAFCGGRSDAERIREQDVIEVFGLASSEELRTLAIGLLQNDLNAAIEVIQALADHGRDLERLYADLVGYVRNLMVCTACREPGRILELAEAELQDAMAVAGSAPPGLLQRLLQGLVAEEWSFRSALNKRLYLEAILARVMLEAHSVQLNDVIAQLLALQQGGQVPSLAVAPPPVVAPPPPPRPARLVDASASVDTRPPAGVAGERAAGSTQRPQDADPAAAATPVTAPPPIVAAVTPAPAPAPAVSAPPAEPGAPAEPRDDHSGALPTPARLVDAPAAVDTRPPAEAAAPIAPAPVTAPPPAVAAAPAAAPRFRQHGDGYPAAVATPAPAGEASSEAPLPAAVPAAVKAAIHAGEVPVEPTPASLFEALLGQLEAHKAGSPLLDLVRRLTPVSLIGTVFQVAYDVQALQPDEVRRLQAPETMAVLRECYAAVAPTPEGTLVLKRWIASLSDEHRDQRHRATAEERARVEAMPFVQAVCTAIGGRVIDVRMPGPESRRGEA
ncbi:MAG: DNA polymerase III subunit gamma/tau [Lentisphaerae bacterium]|nr:DNA polymerase III subunit gamma/tau [Lentisphaerota bacterium]